MQHDKNISTVNNYSALMHNKQQHHNDMILICEKKLH